MSEDIEPWGAEPGPSSFLAAQQAGADVFAESSSADSHLPRCALAEVFLLGNVFLAEALHVCKIKHR